MTGFGRGEYKDEKRTVTAEIKAVNHRFSDITVKMPRRYAFTEDKIKVMVKEAAPRGKVDVSINFDNVNAGDTELRLDLALAQSYYENLRKIRETLPGLEGEVTLQMLSSMPDVLKAMPAEENEEEILAAVTAAVETALASFCAMRRTEGNKLIEDILQRGDIIEKTVLGIEAYAPKVAEKYTLRMKERIQELLGEDAVIPEDRILLEAAVFADKSNITEELVRLKSHVAQLRNICADESAPIGKKLDFLVQEMNRESNTIGSKANDIAITNEVLTLKAEIEKIREQIQNIE